MKKQIKRKYIVENSDSPYESDYQENEEKEEDQYPEIKEKKVKTKTVTKPTQNKKQKLFEYIMQREIGAQVDIGKNVSAFESIGHVPSVDKTASDFEKADTKVKKLKRLIDKDEYDANIARYIPGTLELAYQGILDDIKTIEQVAHPSYKDLETFDFQLLLDKNLYTNLNSVPFVFPIKFKKKADINVDIGADLIIVNNFFCALDKRNKHYKI